MSIIIAKHFCMFLTLLILRNYRNEKMTFYFNQNNGKFFIFYCLLRGAD